MSENYKDVINNKIIKYEIKLKKLNYMLNDIKMLLKEDEGIKAGKLMNEMRKEHIEDAEVIRLLIDYMYNNREFFMNDIVARTRRNDDIKFIENEFFNVSKFLEHIKESKKMLEKDKNIKSMSYFYKSIIKAFYEYDMSNISNEDLKEIYRIFKFEKDEMKEINDALEMVSNLK